MHHHGCICFVNLFLTDRDSPDALCRGYDTDALCRGYDADAFPAAGQKNQEGGKSMQIKLDGALKEVPQAMTVQQLVEQEQYRPDRIAVELNLQIVPKRAYAEQVLQEGDSVEIVGFVGGG